MKNEYSNKLPTTFLAILACLLWSSAFVGIKIGLEYISPLRFAGIRFFFAGLIILPFCGNIFLQIKNITSNIKLIIIVSFLQTFLLYTLFYLGVSQVPSAIAAIVVGTGPITASVLAHIYMDNDKLNLKKTISLLFGILGILVISFGKKSFDGNSEILGILMLLLSSISSAGSNIVVAKQKCLISPLLLNSLQMMLGGLLLYIVSLFCEEGLKAIPDLKFYVSLSWLTFLSAAAFSIWFTLLKRPEVKVSNLNIWKFIIPVFGAVLSWALIPSESPTISSCFGMALIGVSIIILNWKGINIKKILK